MAHARGALSKGLVGLGVLLLGVAFSTGARATTISVALPGLTGPLPHLGAAPGIVQLPGVRGPGDPGYRFVGGGTGTVRLPGARVPGDPGYNPLVDGVVFQPDRTASFDLGTAFSSISQVSLQLVGHTECPEGGCSVAPQLSAFLRGTPAPGTLFTPLPGISISGPLSGEFEISLALPAVQELADGTGAISLLISPFGGPVGARVPWGQLTFGDGGSPLPPGVVIRSARLTVVGDALGDDALPPQTIPEPSMLALAGAALGMFGVLRRKAS